MTRIRSSGNTDSVFSTDDERWTAVIDRDQAADGVFCYAVVTTGIYCRPTCPSRRPRRENVRFHENHVDAERAGFRPCKRCRPDQPTLAERQAQAVTAACRHIEAAETAPDIDELARTAGMSRFHFQRVFKELTGVTPRAYITALRGAKTRDVLRRSGSVTAAIYEAGFNSTGRFYETAPSMLGMAPSAYRAGGVGLTIRFALGECWLGSLLIAATDRGLCAISLGDEPASLLHELQDRFPKATLLGADPEFEGWMAQVVGFIQDPAQGLNLPLDIRGTAFQQQVWQALRDIPFGSTASYAEIAARIGRPKAVRAVARACATNTLAVAIPCHRVVRTDGSPSGYRWGIERKHALLEREGAK